MISDAELAWRLADETAACLNRSQRAVVFVELGSGECRSAIERILALIASKNVPLSAGTLSAMTEWLDQYHGHVQMESLRPLLARIVGA